MAEIASTKPIRGETCLSTAIQKARDRQRVGTGAAP